MRETNFIKQNQDKWKEFEKILDKDSKDPDKLSDLFVQITDDLSYSRTFYPNRSVRVYLNNLAQQIFYSIYKNKKTRMGRLTYFWTDELPQLVYESRVAFRISFFVFTLALIIGAISSAMDVDFCRTILGDGYVDMTLENIESGDPMAVYKDHGRFGMSLGITANNLFVAFLTFVLGAFFAIGSIAILLSNGVMIGAFQYFFYEQGLFRESFLTIWMHGTLEISAIIIAGAAGITMGRGLVMPGTLTRLQAFQISARRGLKIMIGITPIIIAAGFIESYITRYTETSDWIRLLFILACLFFILGYFVWYPWRKAKQGFASNIRDTKLPPDSALKINFDRIKSSGEIFADIFIFYKKYLKQIGLTAIAAAILFCTVVFVTANTETSQIFEFPYHLLGAIGSIDQFYINDAVPFLPIINIAIYSLIAFVTLTFLMREAGDQPAELPKGYHLFNLIKIVAAITLFQVLFLNPGWYTSLLVIGLTPIIFIWLYIMLKEQTNTFSAMGRTASLLTGTFGRALGLSLLLLCVSILFYSLMDSFLMWFYLKMIGWNVSLNDTQMDQLLAISLTFTSIFIICLIVPMLLSGFGILYYTMIEIKEAPSLKEKIQYIGIRKKIHGLDKEVV